MGNTQFMTKILSLVFLFSIVTSKIEAQALQYETVTVEGKSYYKYRVQPSEGLYAISRLFSVTVADILRSNPDANKGLQIGQELLIPVAQNVVVREPNRDNSANTTQTVSPTNPNQASVTDQNINFNHTVVSGETVYSISRMYNTSVDEIYRLNPSVKETIEVGQILIIPQKRVLSEEKEENYRFHTILPKETLYSVSKTYSLKPEDIIAANPGLSTETFQIGKTIRVPFFESYQLVTPFESQSSQLTHKVERGETLYSISRRYSVEVGDIVNANPILTGGLKPNMELVIPVEGSSLEFAKQRLENDVNSLLTQMPNPEKVGVNRVGLLLPFLDETGGGHLRLQEYYEGFLLSVEEMKNRGANLELYVFEIGKGNDVGKLQSLLQTLEMQSLNLIIGGVNDTQIKVISDFSKERNIKYVVPFSQSNGEILNNGNIFQVNPLTKSQIDKASSKFIEKFRNSNVIFVSCGNNNKIEFITQLQNSLRTNNISFESVGSVSTLDSFLLSLLKPDRENIIIPTSGEMSDVSSIIDELKTLQESNSQIKIRLFGYPEWQTYNSLIGDFHHFDTYIYSPFFVNENSTEVQTFKDKFSRWYNRSLLDTNPGYGMWGYDTGLFFLTAIQQYGVNFEQNIDKVQINSLQFPFNFVRLNNWGGFFNTGLYFINYEANGRLTKIDISK